MLSQTWPIASTSVARTHFIVLFRQNNCFIASVCSDFISAAPCLEQTQQSEYCRWRSIRDSRWNAPVAGLFLQPWITVIFEISSHCTSTCTCTLIRPSHSQSKAVCFVLPFWPTFWLFYHTFIFSVSIFLAQLVYSHCRSKTFTQNSGKAILFTLFVYLPILKT